jgi:hypothetical protein
MRRVFVCLAAVAISAAGPAARAAVELRPADTLDGYLARLLINESPFPGEKGYVSEKDTQAAMTAILWVVHSRVRCIPKGYTQRQVASVTTDDIIDVITAGGERGQMDGFYRNAQGQFLSVPRVEERISNLVRIANTGKPGRFARLLNHGQELASTYVEGIMQEPDRYEALRAVGPVQVTGRAYSWMTDRDYYNPGGDFIRIPNEQAGSLGGNRFFTLKQRR